MTGLSQRGKSDSDFEQLVRALDRYGHHDHDCEQHDVFAHNIHCSCGFNRVLQDALAGRAPSVVRTTRKVRG